LRQPVEIGGGFPGAHGDLRTSLRQPADDGQADSLASAGDDGTAPRQTQIHSLLPSRCVPAYCGPAQVIPASAPSPVALNMAPEISATSGPGDKAYGRAPAARINRH